MNLQSRLYEHERGLLLDQHQFDPSKWTKSGWPDKDHPGAGMRVDRIHRAVGKDRVMLHRFTADKGGPALHTHPFMLAAHILGPGTYEVGFGHKGVVTSRVSASAPYYYEMLTREVQHYVLPTGPEPVYTIAIWVPFLAKPLPGHAVTDRLCEPNELRAIIQHYFEQVYG